MKYQVCIKCLKRGVSLTITKEERIYKCKYCGFTRHFPVSRKLPKGAGMQFFKGLK